MPDDASLLRLYAEQGSETAFAELVERHLGLVYSAALRKTNGNVHRAEEVAQSVFTALARKAAPLSRRTTLAGWLYLSTHHAAAELIRREQRRQAREQEAFTMQEISQDSTPAIDWDKIHPVLDEIIRKLGDLDREAVLLRFFEQRPFAEIGATLHLNEDAARKRVDRALDKLRAGLASRGITSTVGALSAALATNSAVAAPAGLAIKVSAGAVAAGATGEAATSFQVLFASYLKAGLFGVTLLAAAAIAVQQSLRDNSADAPAAPKAEPVAFAPAAEARSRAIIVIGLTTDAEQSARLHQQAEAARRGFVARGIPVNSIQLLAPGPGVTITRETVLAAIRDTNPQRRETWLLLLGTAAASRDGRAAYQVSGPRLSPDDIAAAVGTLPGEKFVVVSTSLSGSFLPPLLALAEVEAVAATAEAGEINEPRFGDAWTMALLAQPKATFAEIAGAAANRVEAFYRKKELGQGEHARLIDRAANTIIDVPVAAPTMASAPSAPR